MTSTPPSTSPPVDANRTCPVSVVSPSHCGDNPRWGPLFPGPERECRDRAARRLETAYGIIGVGQVGEVNATPAAALSVMQAPDCGVRDRALRRVELIIGQVADRCLVARMAPETTRCCRCSSEVQTSSPALRP